MSPYHAMPTCHGMLSDHATEALIRVMLICEAIGDMPRCVASLLVALLSTARLLGQAFAEQQQVAFDATAEPQVCARGAGWGCSRLHIPACTSALPTRPPRRLAQLQFEPYAVRNLTAAEHNALRKFSNSLRIL